MFYLSCKANAGVKFAKTGQGQHSYRLVVICIVLSLFVLFCCDLYCSVVICIVLCFVCVSVCTVTRPPDDNPIAVNKCISFPGLRRPERGFDHPPPLAQRLK